jgi:hypothetical protein
MEPNTHPHFFPDLDPPMLRNDLLRFPPFHFDADPDPAFHFDADGADPGPASQNDADPCGFGSATLSL